ncbi:MAG: hypothetical protein IPK16_23325 [Anaerolineales bacterium]|nr:hypothetical protein [Anaerolineales bacterium]
MSAQPAEQQMAFGCPEIEASVGAGYKLLFEHGYMLGFDMAPDLLVVYEDSGEWERAIAPGDAAPPPDVGPEAPPGRFGWLWSQGSRSEELGLATSPEPMRFDAVYQSFPSAVMVGDRGNMEVTVLTADQQR